MEQSPSEIIMVRPRNFAFDPTTADSNAFQNRPDKDKETLVKAKAIQEFDQVVKRFREVGIHVKVFEDNEDPIPKPDAIFPNNWFSTHSNGMVLIYPMLSPNRQAERRLDVIDYLIGTNKVKEILDMSANERNDNILEGTGSIVFDHLNKIAYACRSPRTSDLVFNRVCNLLNYKPVMFNSHDSNGKLIYHTNVILWIGSKAIGVCLDSIKDAKEKELVSSYLRLGDREILDLNQSEILGFAGNCLELRNDQGQTFLAISKRAMEAMNAKHVDQLKPCFHDILECDVETIEHVGGGGIRCMIAGVHL
ncbi:hypothetical protein TCAL_06721 [Tigriopus californicus]|uniref:Amidinotransferase n=1 Tax=Tigriopus californicus TaxID=6832 RepID=A0A553P2J9_TIGCA|nr:uncharacterized protein LOC131883225 [Tigriopus californicus]TRY71904.1 hypothetical protein TCAL_06721 [Tigriopus californicus]